MLLFYVRHGDPIYNPDSLTSQGLAQADALVERMKICAPQKIYSSSSNRAILTAKPTANFLGLDIEVLDWCNEGLAWDEFTYINNNGRRRWFFESSENVSLFNTDEFYNLGDNWCSHAKFVNTNAKFGLDRIKKQTDLFMKELGYIRKGKGFVAKNPSYNRVALFAHQGFGMAFLSCLLDIPYPIFCTRFDMGHTGITVIQFNDNGFTVPKAIQVSNDSHIFADKSLKTVYQNKIEF